MGTILRSLWRQIKRHWVAIGVGAIVCVVVIALIVAIIGGYRNNLDWTGVGKSEGKTTTTWITPGTTTATPETTVAIETQPAKSVWDWFLISSSIATTLGIIAGGWRFIIRPSIIPEAQVSLSLKDVATVNGIRIAIVGVRFKNLGSSRITNLRCYSSTTPIDVKPGLEGIRLISEEPFDLRSLRDISEYFNVIEPNEEKTLDIVFALYKTTLFKVRVRFAAREEAPRSWEAVAVFNVDEKAKVPTPTELNQ